MYAFRLRAAAVALLAGVGLSACTTPYGNGISVGLGNGYPYYGAGYGYPAGYGYGSGYGYGYPGYGYGYGYPGYGMGYAPYWGWYDNFYYPGTGYYVYDIDRNPHRWTDEQRQYWEQRREQAMTSDDFRRAMEAQQQNWSGFTAGPASAQQVQTSDGKRVRVQRTKPVRTERQQIERSKAVQVERSRPVRAERVERSSRASEITSRQFAREQRRSEVRAERASRSEARESRKSSDQ